MQRGIPFLKFLFFGAIRNSLMTRLLSVVGGDRHRLHLGEDPVHAVSCHRSAREPFLFAVGTAKGHCSSPCMRRLATDNNTQGLRDLEQRRSVQGRQGGHGKFCC